jgi:hypothetical protein
LKGPEPTKPIDEAKHAELLQEQLNSKTVERVEKYVPLEKSGKETAKQDWALANWDLYGYQQSDPKGVSTAEIMTNFFRVDILDSIAKLDIRKYRIILGKIYDGQDDKSSSSKDGKNEEERKEKGGSQGGKGKGKAKDKDGGRGITTCEISKSGSRPQASRGGILYPKKA